MWLINTTNLQLEQFPDEHACAYAILSHTWEQDEVLFEHMQSLEVARSHKGFAKIESCCRQARADDFKYAWIDTCCIDRRSSAELSEAINSMYKWYQASTVCYAYLCDFSQAQGNFETRLGRHRFALCRWFTRGWTLQELIAPDDLRFYNATWEFIGDKRRLTNLLAQITGVEALVLSSTGSFKKFALQSVSVAAKMSWASRRRTTRKEDESYALMGIFDVNMPLLYGEGQDAFRRLQNSIIARSADHSILLWKPSSPQAAQLFAPSPAGFRGSNQIVQYHWTGEAHPEFHLINIGIQAKVPITVVETIGLCAVLNCRYADDFSGPILLPIIQYRGGTLYNSHDCAHVYPSNYMHGSERRFPVLRTAGNTMSLVDVKMTSLQLMETYLGVPQTFVGKANFIFEQSPAFLEAFRVHDVTPQGKYNHETRTMAWSASCFGSSRTISGSITWVSSGRKGLKLSLELAQGWPNNGYKVNVMEIRTTRPTARRFSGGDEETVVLRQFDPLDQKGLYALGIGTVEIAVKEAVSLHERVVVLNMSFVPSDGGAQFDADKTKSNGSNTTDATDLPSSLKPLHTPDALHGPSTTRSCIPRL